MLDNLVVLFSSIILDSFIASYYSQNNAGIMASPLATDIVSYIHSDLLIIYITLKTLLEVIILLKVRLCITSYLTVISRTSYTSNVYTRTSWIAIARLHYELVI